MAIFFFLRIAGLFLIIASVTGAIVFSFITWYIYFVIGGTLFLSSFNTDISTTFLNLLRKNRRRLICTYIIYIIVAFVIDFIGKLLLGLWHYHQSFDAFDVLIHVYLLGYPFAFFMVYETWLLMKRHVSYFGLAFFATTLLSAFMHEYPNTFADEWIYTIPYTSFDVFTINIVVIMGWAILVFVPLIVNHALNKKKVIRAQVFVIISP